MATRRFRNTTLTEVEHCAVAIPAFGWQRRQGYQKVTLGYRDSASRMKIKPVCGGSVSSRPACPYSEFYSSRGQVMNETCGRWGAEGEG